MFCVYIVDSDAFSWRENIGKNKLSRSDSEGFELAAAVKYY